MKKWLVITLLFSKAFAQSPCSLPEFRQFDFWLGDWEAFGPTGKKAGDSHISQILDSCVILEEWTSTGIQNGIRYAGKSFNTYNTRTRQWQQTWVDNVGGSTEYLEGKASAGQIVFKTAPFRLTADTMAVRRLSFYKISNDRVRQLGEISKDQEKTWVVEYDLDYRRKK